MNLDRLQHWIDQGRLSSSPENPITARQLFLSGCVHDVHDGIKLLGNVSRTPLPSCLSDPKNQGADYFKTPIYIVASRASKSAIKAIEKSNGTVICKYHNPLSLRDCVNGRTDRTSAAPTRREDISRSFSLHCNIIDLITIVVWYGKHHNRGYLSSKTLDTVGNMPFVEDRWRLLSKQLGLWKKQEFDVRK